jgi:hypothetical protein
MQKQKKTKKVRFSKLAEKRLKEIANKSNTELSFDCLVREFIRNGFTKKQSTYLIKLLDDYIPLI